ncbi:hypothetical protein HNQ59_003989 [Chitinivorax tropicus]|uniref:Uncharacterized protein n=1 Tax=Chitinivorax tropicus TaxID=714531 RepID=A0A840MNG4_9PROT|nr:hypothetical protein [Chitinivorax tropicus]MBB5020664.1 hypothetical protein [Chitinivorax tropicus]
MNELRLAWEPENLTPLSSIEERMVLYTKGRGGIIILGNGTLLSLTKGDSDVEDAKKALDEARFITDFRVVHLKEGGYMVAFHDAVAVFVGHDEFEQMKEEILARQNELRFPGEVFFAPPNNQSAHTLIGLYARGKLQRDAYFFSFYKRI